MDKRQSAAANDGQSKPTEPLAIGMDDRYDRLRLIGWWDQRLLQRARVFVVGAGALGNEVLKNLALVGVGQILVIDFDDVELSNLSRSVLFRAEHQGRNKAEVAAEMAAALNPDCRIVGWRADLTKDIGLSLIRGADVVIGCVDNREARLWINRLCWKAGTPWIDGGIQEINGVCKIFVPGNGGCYECAMTENDYRLIQLRYSCPLLSREDMQQGKVPTAPTIASIIGGLQVQEALKLLHRIPTQSGVAIVFNGESTRSYMTRFPVRDDCLSHESYAPIISTELHSDLTCTELLERLQDVAPGAHCLELDRDWLIELTCGHCQRTTPVGRPLADIGQRAGRCDQCGRVMTPHTTHHIERNGRGSDIRLVDLGIPRHDIVKVKSAEQTYFVELNGDRHVSGNRIWQ